MRVLRIVFAVIWLLGVETSIALAQDEMPGMHEHTMPGLLGPSMGREASGTAWQPDSTPMPSPMIHIMSDGWMLMGHGSADAICVVDAQVIMTLIEPR